MSGTFGVQGRWMLLAVLGAVGLLALSGCRSRFVEATVRNASGGAVSVVEVDYPSASFGREVLADGAEYRYRFKVLGNGATKVLWTDGAHHDHSVNGPVLREGQEGRMTVTLTGTSANWDLVLKQP